jgi:hypothetical protein
MSNDLDAAVSEPVIVTSPVTDKVVPSNCKFASPLIVPAVPVAVRT